MSKQYYAVQRTGEKKNELTHWKYIKREKRPNGKWRYYYDKKSLKDDVKNELTKPKEQIVDGKQMTLDDGKVYVKDSVPTKDGYGTYYHKNSDGTKNVLEIREGTDLFNNEKSLTFLSPKSSIATVKIKEIGKLERFIDTAKEWLAIKLFSNKL